MNPKGPTFGTPAPHIPLADLAYGEMPSGRINYGDESERLEKQFAKISTADRAATFVPFSAGQTDAEKTLMQLQEIVNDGFPHTTSKPDTKRWEALKEDINTNDIQMKVDGASYQERMNAANKAFDRAYRDEMAYYVGQLDAQRTMGRDLPDMPFEVVTTEKSEYLAFQQGQTDAFHAMAPKYEGELWPDYKFRRSAEDQTLKMPTDKLIADGKQGATVDVTTYKDGGVELKNSYTLEGQNVVHTAPNGDKQTMTQAESRLHQAEREAQVFTNTANLYDAMKQDNSIRATQGDNTYFVRDDKFVVADKNNNERWMSTEKMDAILADRGHIVSNAVESAHSKLNVEKGEMTQRIEPATARQSVNTTAVAPDDIAVAERTSQTLVEQLQELGEDKALLNEQTGHVFSIEQGNFVARNQEGKAFIEMPASRAQELQKEAIANPPQQDHRSVSLNSSPIPNVAEYGKRLQAQLDQAEDQKVIEGMSHKTPVERLQEKGEGSTILDQKTGNVSSLEDGNYVVRDREGEVVKNQPIEKAQAEQFSAGIPTNPTEQETQRKVVSL